MGSGSRPRTRPFGKKKGALPVFTSMRFVTEGIDCGMLAVTKVASGPSPYGVWGALGSKDGGEGKVDT